MSERVFVGVEWEVGAERGRSELVDAVIFCESDIDMCGRDGGGTSL